MAFALGMNYNNLEPSDTYFSSLLMDHVRVPDNAFFHTHNGFCFLWVLTFASRSCLNKLLRFYYSVFIFV